MGEAKTAFDLTLEYQVARARVSINVPPTACDPPWQERLDKRVSLRCTLSAIPANANEQIAVLKNKLTLANASCEAAGVLLLEVQGDCIDQRQRALHAEKERDDARAELARLREQPVPATIQAGPITVGSQVPMKKCPACDGKGFRLRYWGADKVVLSDRVPCERCSGTGRVVAT